MTNGTKRKVNYSVCAGPISHECDECEELINCMKKRSGELTWFSILPHYITDHLMTVVSPSAFKLYIYLNRRVGFSREDPNYCKTSLTYEQINACTGLSVNHIKKYADELASLDLITHSQTRTKTPDGRITTSNIFEVKWRGYHDHLGIKLDKRFVP